MFSRVSRLFIRRIQVKSFSTPKILTTSFFDYQKDIIKEVNHNQIFYKTNEIEILLKKFYNDTFPTKNLLTDEKKIVEFLIVITQLNSTYKISQLANYYFDVLLSKENLDKLKCSGEFICNIGKILEKNTYYNHDLCKYLADRLIRDQKLDISAISTIINFLGQSSFLTNEEEFGEALSKVLMKDIHRLNYNHFYLMLDSISEYKITYTFLQIIELNIIKKMKRFYRLNTIFKIITSLEKIEKNGYKVKVWKLFYNFIMHNPELFIKNILIYGRCLLIIKEKLPEYYYDQNLIDNYFRCSRSVDNHFGLSFFIEGIVLETGSFDNKYLPELKKFIESIEQTKEAIKIIHSLYSARIKHYGEYLIKRFIIDDGLDIEILLDNTYLRLFQYIGFFIQKIELLNLILQELNIDVSDKKINYKLISMVYYIYSKNENTNLIAIFKLKIDSIIKRVKANIEVNRELVELLIVLKPFIDQCNLNLDEYDEVVLYYFNTQTNFFRNVNDLEIIMNPNYSVTDIEELKLLSYIKTYLNITMKEMRNIYQTNFYSSVYSLDRNKI